MTVASRPDVPPQDETFTLTPGGPRVFAATLSVYEAGDIEVFTSGLFGRRRLVQVDEAPDTVAQYQISDLVPGEGFNITVHADTVGTLIVQNAMEFSQPFSFSESRAYRGQDVENALDRLAVLAALAETQIGSGELADNSVTPPKLQADTEDQKAAIRDRIGAAHDQLELAGYGILRPRVTVTTTLV